MAKKNKKQLKTVSFEKEVVTKDIAVKILFESPEKIKVEKASKCHGDNGNEDNESKTNFSMKDNSLVKAKKKRKKPNKTNSVNGDDCEHEESHGEIKVKRKRKKLETNVNDGAFTKNVTVNIGESVEKIVKRKKKLKKGKPNGEPEVVEEVSVENPKVKTAESMRAQKKKKHLQLLEDKRLKTELVTQQNALNYLSKWKHCRNEWKFEKLKQIWLQQSLFDTTKVPGEFWGSIVEYFSGSKGFIRNVVLRDALKILEKEDTVIEQNADENNLILQRARDIVQNLQE